MKNMEKILNETLYSEGNKTQLELSELEKRRILAKTMEKIEEEQKQHGKNMKRAIV